MKFSTAIIATLAAVGVEAKKSPTSLDAKTLQNAMKNVDKKQLLRRARKLDQQQAQGDDAAAAEDENVEISSDYFIKFNSCASLKILDVEDVSTYITNTQYSGSNVDLSSLNIYKDYIVFDATSASSGQTIQYVIDVQTYVQTLIQATPNAYEEYCKTCEEAYDSCVASSATSTASANDGGRKLTTNTEYVDCDTCYANGCFYQAQNEGGADGAGAEGNSVYTDSSGYTSNNALEWLNGVAQCQEVNQDSGYANFNGYYTLYAGLTCNAAGSGVEIGLFANEECTLQSTQTTFSNIVKSEPQISGYFELTKTLVEQAFTQTTSCAETTFASPFDNNDNNDGNRRRLQEDEDNQENADEDNADANADENADQEEDADANADENNANGDDNADQEDANADENQQEDEQAEEDQDPVNEICQALTEDSFALSQSCNNGNSYQYDENGNAWGTYYYGSYGTITYDITDAADEDQVCVAMKKKSGYYNRVGSGSSTKMYNYNGRKTNTFTWDVYSGSSTNGYNPNGSSSSSNGSSSNGNSFGNNFDWEGTKQQIGDTYNNVSEKVGNGINRASEQTGLEVEEVIGVVVGVLAALCLFTIFGCFCCCKKDQDEKQVNLIPRPKGEIRHEWKAQDKWNNSRDKSTWA